MTRSECLQKAEQIINGDRDEQYGSPENSFKEIARLWSCYLDKQINAHDVAIMMTLFKVARIKTGAFKADSYIDCAGYIACASEIGDADK